jgi:hypothetical protein
MPLSGIRVVDVTRILAEPFCSMLLAALTARAFGKSRTRCWPRFPPLPAEECLLPTPLPIIGSVYGDDGPCP